MPTIANNEAGETAVSHVAKQIMPSRTKKFPARFLHLLQQVVQLAAMAHLIRKAAKKQAATMTIGSIGQNLMV
jgi:hypothetical protein